MKLQIYIFLESLKYMHSLKYYFIWLVWFMVLNATFNNISVISCQSDLLVEEIGVSGENQGPAIKSQTNFITYCCMTWAALIGTDYIGICKSNYHTITITTVFSFILSSFVAIFTNLVCLAHCLLNYILSNIFYWCCF